jgi:ribosomal protein L44E
MWSAHVESEGKSEGYTRSAQNRGGPNQRKVRFTTVQKSINISIVECQSCGYKTRVVGMVRFGRIEL